MANWHRATVQQNHAWSDNLFSLKVDYPHGDFIAGQFVRLALEINGERVQRAYSLVNPPGVDYAEIYFTSVADGKLSPALATLQAGDSVDISYPASGFFTLEEVPQGEALWLISTGTGIGPFLSMLGTDAPWQRFNRIVLVHGVRWQRDLAYQSLIQQLQQQHPGQLDYVPVVSRESVQGTLQGHLTQHLQNGAIQAQTGVPINPHSQVMLCGNPQMISECKTWLLEQGLEKNLRRKPGQITTEQYW